MYCPFERARVSHVICFLQELSWQSMTFFVVVCHVTCKDYSRWYCWLTKYYLWYLTTYRKISGSCAGFFFSFWKVDQCRIVPLLSPTKISKWWVFFCIFQNLSSGWMWSKITETGVEHVETADIEIFQQSWIECRKCLRGLNTFFLCYMQGRCQFAQSYWCFTFGIFLRCFPTAR